MKKAYGELELEVIRFSSEDIITASAEEVEDTCDADINLDDYTRVAVDGPWELYKGPDGHYYEYNTETGEFNDLGDRV